MHACALRKHPVRRDVDESKAASLLDIGPLGTDFSLKQGEKITIKPMLQFSVAIETVELDGRLQ